MYKCSQWKTIEIETLLLQVHCQRHHVVYWVEIKKKSEIVLWLRLQGKLLQTVIAKQFFFLENINILILFQMLPIPFRYIEPFSKNTLIIHTKKPRKILTSIISLKFMNQSKGTRPRTMSNLPLQWILKRIKQFYSLNGWNIRNISFFIFHFYVFVNNKRTVIARKLIFLENIDNLILFRMVCIPFRYIKPFSRNKPLTSNISEIHGSILLTKELTRLVYNIYP